MSNSIVLLRKFVESENVKGRLNDMLGKRGGAFANSIINVYRNSSGLQKCTPESVVSAAMVAASMNLAIDPALGYAAIVPYGNSASFQLMYKGITQLCIRSGEYERIHVTEVYKDEIESFNAITGDVKFTGVEDSPMRLKSDLGDVAGFYAMFKLLKGFHCSGYITYEQAIAHGRKFSKAFQYDIKQKKQTSVWSTDPIAMGKKTILKAILTKQGIMSLEMQDAVVAEGTPNFEEARENAENSNEAGQEVIDVQPADESQEVESQDDNPDAWKG